VAHRKKSAAALTNFGRRSGAPHFFWRRRRKYVSGWRGGGIRRLTGLTRERLYIASWIQIFDFKLSCAVFKRSFLQQTIWLYA